MKMKKMHAVIACLLCVAMLCSLPMLISYAEEDANTLTGEAARTTEELTLADGTKTGVYATQITLQGSTYGDRLVNVAEFDLSNTHLSVEVINSGEYMVSTQTVAAAAESYSNSHEGQTVLAALNGDLWMTAVHSNKNVTSKVLAVPRGVLIIDREIWATEQIDQENLMATNAEKGTPSPNKAAFGVTDKNQPLVGSPDITLTLVNKTQNKTVQPDGLNRLPAMDSMIVYNHRVNNQNYALKDAYEIEIEVSDSAVTLNGKVTGKVKRIYPSGAVTRPEIGENTVVLTARGNRIDAISDFAIGDEIEIGATLVDRYGKTEQWQNVVDAIGGHMTALMDGMAYTANGSTGTYPTSFVGYRADGKVMFVTVTAQEDGKYAGLQYAKAQAFCRELGYNDVFYLDGGGSTTMVVLEEGEYTVRSKSSDGSARSVINSVAVVWNTEAVCDKQGSLSYITSPVDFSEVAPTYLDGAFLADLVANENAVSSAYDQDCKAMRLTTTQKTQDPNAVISFTEFKRVEAKTYPYIVLKVKTDNTASTSLVLYYAAGDIAGATAGYTVGQTLKSGNDWQYLIYDMSKAKGWDGNINSLRLDIFDSVYTDADVSVWFGGLTLCKTAEEANKVKDGYIPEGAIADYLAYMESLQSEETTVDETEQTTDPDNESKTEAPTDEAPTDEAPTDEETTTGEENVTPDAGEVSTSEPATKTGCGGVMTAAAVPMLLTGAWMLLGRRKENENEGENR